MCLSHHLTVPDVHRSQFAGLIAAQSCPVMLAGEFPGKLAEPIYTNDVRGRGL